MSVTFSLPGIPSLIFVGKEHEFSYQCCEVQYACGCDFVDGPGINMSNSNALTLLAVLGIPEADYYGSMPVAEFKGYLLAGLALVDDSAVADAVDKLPGCATFVDCGTPEGYRSGRINQLLDLCDQAVSLGIEEIQWG